jgi:hypothetical protein
VYQLVYENDAIALVLLHQLGRNSLFPIYFFNCHEFILSRIAIATERCAIDGSPTVDLVRKATHFSILKPTRRQLLR